MKTGIFIPTYNASKDLPYFLRSLQVLNKLDRELFRVLFIDSSSSDRTLEYIAQYEFNYTVIPQAEFDHGRTRQLAATLLDDCEVIIYLTQDAELCSIESIYALTNVFRDKTIATAFGRQLPHANADIFALENRNFNYPSFSYVRTYEDRFLYGIKTVFSSDSFAAYRRDVLFEVGGFPEHCIVSEDMCVVAKMLILGYSLSYVSQATCFHSHNYSLLQEFGRYFDIGVFFATHEWIKQNFGSADSEGKKSIFTLAKQVLVKEPWLLPSFCLRVFIRIISYKLGTYYKYLPIPLVKKISTQKQYWTKLCE